MPPRTRSSQNRPALAVVLPVRDGAATLAEAIDSVLAQEGVTVALTVIDDGSVDATPTLLSALTSRHRQLNVIRTQARGLPRALNLGIEHSRQDLIARMDADDVCRPGRLSAQVGALARAPETAALGCQVTLFPEAEVGEGMRAYVRWQHSLTSTADHRAQLFVESPLCHPTVVLRRSALLRVGGYRDGPFPEDYDLWLRLDAAGFGLAKVPVPLLAWRQGPGRATVTDARYGPDRFLACKAPFLARRLATRPGPITIWGAGKTGKHLARALEPHGVRVERFIDIDPRKLGRTARGAPIVDPDALQSHRSAWTVVAVGARGARDLVRTHLARIGYREGRDFLCGS